MPSGPERSEGRIRRVKLAPEEEAHLTNTYGTVQKGVHHLIRKDKFDKAVPDGEGARRAYLALEAWCRVNGHKEDGLVPVQTAADVVMKELALENRANAWTVLGELQAQRFAIRSGEFWKVLRRRRDEPEESAVIEALKQGAL